jgi:hypothetical protein
MTPLRHRKYKNTLQSDAGKAPKKHRTAKAPEILNHDAAKASKQTNRAATWRPQGTEETLRRKGTGNTKTRRRRRIDTNKNPLHPDADKPPKKHGAANSPKILKRDAAKSSKQTNTCCNLTPTRHRKNMLPQR